MKLGNFVRLFFNHKEGSILNPFIQVQELLVIYPSDVSIYYNSNHKPPGRNGGHLTPHLSFRFLPLEKIYGKSEAVKSYLLERHTADIILKFIEDRPGFAEKVDLVAGGMMQVMRGQEETQARKDWEAAKEAGVDMGKEGIIWVGKDEMVQVGRMLP